MKNLVLYLFVLLISVSATAQKTLDELLKQYNTQSIPYISIAELRMKMTQDIVLVLDAREFEEFEVSHIPSANYVGFSTFSSEDISEKIKNKAAAIVVYCSLGIRSEEIGEKLKKIGFTNVKNLYGGIFEWKNKEYPIIDIEGKETEKVHTCTKSWSKWLEKGIKIY